MEKGKVILDQERFALTIERLCYQLIEDFDQFENTCFVGIQPRGTFVSDRIHQRLLELTLLPHIEYGKLDITFYRDDFRIRTTPLRPSPTQMDFLVEDKNVILFDDVLYTGRTVQATLTALQHYGRPKHVRLLALVDRRFNRHLPIRADYVGFRVDALDEAYVKVEWTETEGHDRVLLFPERDK